MSSTFPGELVLLLSLPYVANVHKHMLLRRRSAELLRESFLIAVKHRSSAVRKLNRCLYGNLACLVLFLVETITILRERVIITLVFYRFVVL